MDGRDFKTGDYQGDLANFLRGSFLDEVNAVIRDDEKVRERFLDVASGNFAGNRDAVPDSYGLVDIPTFYTMGRVTVSISQVMGEAVTTAAERSLETLKRFTFPEQFAFLLEHSPIENRTSVKEVELPDYLKLASTEKVNIYEEAVARYRNEKELKGLLLEKTA
jgi:hypothetical protein